MSDKHELVEQLFWQASQMDSEAQRNDFLAEACGEDAELRREVEELRERIKVLERIATDGKQDLALQIESLRDLQEIDDLTDQLSSKQESAR